MPKISEFQNENETRVARLISFLVLYIKILLDNTAITTQIDDSIKKIYYRIQNTIYNFKADAKSSN